MNKSCKYLTETYMEKICFVRMLLTKSKLGSRNVHITFCQEIVDLCLHYKYFSAESLLLH